MSRLAAQSVPFRDCAAILACPATGEKLVAGEREFVAPQPRGTRTGHAAVEAKLLLGGGRSGGVFVMDGRKRAPTTSTARTALV